jgi:hypothetical protein
MSNNIKDKKHIENIAARIAHDIMSVNTDFRGNLFAHVATELKKQGQNFTGNCVFAAAEWYGVNPNE